MQYHRNGHALIKRIEKRPAQEIVTQHYLSPGEGILFYKLGKTYKSDRRTIYHKAQKAFKNDLLEIFAVLDEDIGLLLAPSLDQTHASTAYIDYETPHFKPQAKLARKDNSLVYIGIFAKDLAELESKEGAHNGR